MVWDLFRFALQSQEPDTNTRTHIHTQKRRETETERDSQALQGPSLPTDVLLVREEVELNLHLHGFNPIGPKMDALTGRLHQVCYRSVKSKSQLANQ